MMKTLSIFLVIVFAVPAWGWGRRGHQIVGETAAYLASQTPGAEPLKNHSFDLGYYNNVPDVIWKRPTTYMVEKPQHFMDMEIFERAFARRSEVQKPLDLTRKKFDAQFPEIKVDAGRAYWRIREMFAQLENIGAQLKATPEEDVTGRHALQGKWLIIGGTMGHYVADLSMPLHMSENHDGSMTSQKGIHPYYEETCVNGMFPQLLLKVHSLAKRRWAEYQTKQKGKSVYDLTLALAEESKKNIGKLLEIDKKSKRDEVKKTCAKYEAMITAGLAHSSLVLAEMYRRTLGWKFDDNKFFFFAGEPEYIPPGEPNAPVTSQR